MKSLLMCLLFILLSPVAFSKAKIDSALLKKIMAMFKEDQRWRNEAIKPKPSFNEATINRNMSKTDSLNMIEAKMIVKRYGFPGYSMVGEGGSDCFWAIIQHCDQDVAFQQRVLALMSKEVRNNNATGGKFALLQDRVLISLGHKQLYGSQVNIDPKTHQAKPFPIQDSLKVDSRRKAVGLPPLKDYLRLFDRH